MLRRLISPTRTRARIYDRDANLLLDSRHLYSRGQILRYDLPPVDEDGAGPCRPHPASFVDAFFRRTRPAGLHEQPGGNGAVYPGSDERADRQPVDRSCASANRAS